ncbi:MAG: hypothetical protein R3F53_28940 [Gammaproteobacteria bacterium]
MNFTAGRQLYGTLNSGINDSDAIDPPDDYSAISPVSALPPPMSHRDDRHRWKLPGVLTATPAANVDADRLSW